MNKSLSYLEHESWLLRIRLERLAVIAQEPEQKKRFYRAYCHALARWDRRLSAVFNYHPDGFALPPVQPSGVVGQGATL